VAPRIAPPFDAYLARLDLDAEPPSADALFRIHRAHLERVPYETLWIHMGARWGVGLDNSVARIATQGRGGYCFHLNGALSELLRALGYDVVRHIGGVHGPGGPGEAEMTNHLVLTVHGLPTDANPDGGWYVDAGLGDALYEPLPLLTGTYEQAPLRFTLEATPGALGDWHFTHDPDGSFTGMAWRSEPTAIDAFADRNVFLSTSPESGFVKVLTVQLRDGTGIDILHGLTLKRVGSGAFETTLTSEAEFAQVIREVFGLDLAAFGDDARDALWVKVHDAHERWVAAGRP
jgi:N-hydroxyarylamine O-acetyltransferase